MPENHSRQDLKVLYQCYLMALFGVVIMVVLGGYTRLTGSGLSMVNWDLYRDLLPPMNTAQWMVLFDEYKTSPEFTLVNSWMSLKDFKQIFWLEYTHRVMGRVLGVLFLVPVVFTFLKNALSSYRMRTLVLFFLGALQGAMGWYMVKSGLIKDPAVSHFRLAAHLGIAFFCGACLFWTLQQISNQLRSGATAQGEHPKFLQLFREHKVALPAVFIIATITYGAFVAGLKAGLMYNEFPFMGGRFIPEEAFNDSAVLKGLFNNPVTIQWVHRVLAMTTLALSLHWIFKTKKNLEHRESDRTRVRVQSSAIHTFTLVLILQVALGVITLLYVVPLNPAVFHQLNAFFLVLSGMRVLFVLSPNYIVCVEENLSQARLST